MKPKNFDKSNLLWQFCKKMPEDYIPYGTDNRDEGEAFGNDCSCGCRHYVELSGWLGCDWGVCTNPQSHRAGLLTWEHQGCRKFEQDDD